jgi:hypothetical protein
MAQGAVMGGGDFMHNIILQHADAQARVTKAATPAEYRGWEISWDYGCYTATSPDYDASWEGEEDGWVDNGLRTSARTLPDLYLEVDEMLAGEGE